MDKLLELAKDSGVSTDEVGQMYRNGLTEGMAKKIVGLGVPFLELRNMYFQFGPPMFSILRAFLGYVNMDNNPPAPSPPGE